MNLTLLKKETKRVKSEYIYKDFFPYLSFLFQNLTETCISSTLLYVNDNVTIYSLEKSYSLKKVTCKNKNYSLFSIIQNLFI